VFRVTLTGDYTLLGRAAHFFSDGREPHKAHLGIHSDDTRGVHVGHVDKDRAVLVRQRQLLTRCDDQALEGVPDGVREVVGHGTCDALDVLGLGTNALGPTGHGHEVLL